MNDYRDFAINIASEAGAIIRQNFTLGMKKEWKEDKTPITVTDQVVNDVVVSKIQAAFPHHDILAEEGSPGLTGSEYVWVCDPVDGTIPFSHGVPTFTFSLGLVRDGVSILGVVYDPMQDRMYVGEKGKGALMNGERLRANNLPLDHRAFIDFEWNRHIPVPLLPLATSFAASGVKLTTGLSMVYYGALVAQGNCTAVVADGTSAWDCAALAVLIEEAGGKVTDLHGKQQRYDQPVFGLIASNGVVHDKLVALVQKSFGTESQ